MLQHPFLGRAGCEILRVSGLDPLGLLCHVGGFCFGHEGLDAWRHFRSVLLLGASVVWRVATERRFLIAFGAPCDRLFSQHVVDVGHDLPTGPKSTWTSTPSSASHFMASSVVTARCRNETPTVSSTLVTSRDRAAAVRIAWRRYSRS